MAARKANATGRKVRDLFDEDDNDVQTSEAVKRDVARISGKSEDDEDTVVDLDEPEDDVDALEEQQPTRREKRRERGQTLLASEKEKSTLLEQTLEATRRQNEQLLGLAQRALPQGQQFRDPLDDEDDAVYQRQDALVKEFNAAPPKTPQEVEAYNKRVREIERSKYEVAARRVARNAQNSPQAQQQEMMRTAQAKYPDVVSNAQAFQWAQSRHRQLVLEGNPDDWSTSDKAIADARRQFRIGDQGQVQRGTDPTLRSKLAGQPRGGAAAAPGTREVVMTKQNRRMADAAYPHIKDPSKRYRKWAVEVGSKTSGKDD